MGDISEAKQKQYYDNGCAMRPMTELELLEQKRDQCIKQLASYEQLITWVKNNTVPDHILHMFKHI